MILKRIKQITLILFACICIVKAQNTNVSFLPVQNYFVKNNFKNTPTLMIKITNNKYFDSIFGMATTMGKDGKPTVIDFKKQFILAIVKKESNQPIELKALSITKTKSNQLTYTYTNKTDKAGSFSMCASLLVMLDNKFINYSIVQNERKIK